MLIRAGGGSQAQDHGQAIYAKIRYSVSSTFATGCSMKTEDESKINRFYKQKFQIIFVFTTIQTSSQNRQSNETINFFTLKFFLTLYACKTWDHGHCG